MNLVMHAKRMGLLVVAALALLSPSPAQAFYNPHTGRWLSRDPIGERGGRNPYGFTQNTPISLYDWLGLYELQFDWFDGFTKDEKKTVADLIDQTGVQAQTLSDEIAKLIPKMKADHTCCPGIITQLEALKKLMDRIVVGAKSKTENLEVEKSNLDPESQGPAQMVTYPIPLTDDAPVPGLDPVLQLSTNPKAPWAKKLDVDTMLHELSHKYGTEDDDSEGELLRTGALESYTSHGVEKSTAFQGLLKQCPTTKKPMKPIPKM